jgi:hypothetical protein
MKLSDRIKKGENIRCGAVYQWNSEVKRWFQFPLDRLYHLGGLVRVMDFDTDEMVVVKMPERKIVIYAN